MTARMMRAVIENGVLVWNGMKERTVPAAVRRRRPEYIRIFCVVNFISESNPLKCYP